MAAARFTIEGDGRTGRCSFDGLVTEDDVRALTAVVERHLAGLDVLFVEGADVTALEPSATRAIAALQAACRPSGIAFVVRQPSDALLIALDTEGFGESLCAGLAAGR